MKKDKPYLKVIGGSILTVGIVLGFIITAVIVWGDLEASVFTSGINGEKSLKNLNCPVFITPKEIGTVSVVLKNPANKLSDRYLRAYITEGYASLVRETKTKIPLPPNGKQKVEWKVYPEDAAYKRVILFRVYMNAKYPYPSMSGNCGIVKIDIPWLNGNQILIITSSLTLITMILGVVFIELGSQETNSKRDTMKNAIYFLAGSLIFSSVVSYFGMWLVGLLGLAVGIILVGVILFRR